MVKYLLDCGADFTKKDKAKQTPLQVGAKHKELGWKLATDLVAFKYAVNTQKQQATAPTMNSYQPQGAAMVGTTGGYYHGATTGINVNTYPNGGY